MEQDEQKQKQVRPKVKKLNLIQRWLITHKLKQLESRYTKLLNTAVKDKQTGKLGRKETVVEYNRSLLMPMYREEVVAQIAKSKVEPVLVNNLKPKKHSFGEDKEKEFKFRLAMLEVTEDLCRVNNWTTRQDWKKHEVPMNRLFKELMKSAVEYGDILKFYAKLRFDERRKETRGF